MQRSGTKAIRTQIQPSKPKQKITKITNSQNTKRTYGKSNENLSQREHMVNQVSSCFPKGGHSATQTELKII